jgi:hypothetical protein
MVTRRTDIFPMRRALLLLAAALPVAAQDALPSDLAAAHPEGKWRIRKADLYVYLARYESRTPAALAVFSEYLKLRLVEDESAKRKVTVTDAEVDAWLAELDARVKREGQPGGLKAYLEQYNMSEEELRRKGRQWVQQEKVARAILKEKDPARPDGPVSEESVIFVIDTLYKDAEKKLEGLPEGVVARIRGVDITEYEYGRALSIELPANDVLRALKGLVLVEEVALLTGDRNPPTAEEIEAHRRWLFDSERTRIRRGLKDAPDQITDDMVEQVLKQRGLSVESLFKNPAFLAQARVIGHFRKSLTEEDLRSYHTDHQGQYGEQLRVARILVGARGQEVPGVGRPIRTMAQGKKDADDIYERLRAGQDFAQLARERSEDPDAIRDAGGIVGWIHADSPGYQDTFRQAVQLGANEISKPFFSQGRGFVIVRLLDRQPAPDYEAIREAIRGAGARDRYLLWAAERTRAARINDDLLGKR